MDPAIMTNLGALTIAPLVQLITFVYVRRRFKLVKKSLQQKILLYVCISNAVVVIITIMSTSLFQNNILAIAIVTPMAPIVSFIVCFFIIKILNEQVETIDKQITNTSNILRASSEASVNLSNNATELAASANEVNSSAEEIAATTMEVTLKAKDQAESLTEINSMAQDIGRITKMITNLSEQTNLLALNASIEAGRAGDAGLGFAVVADKVQKLAEESKTSVERTVDIVALILQKIEKATKNSEEISSAMEEISTAAEEQTASMEEISATAGHVGHEAESLKAQLNQHGITQSSIPNKQSYK